MQDLLKFYRLSDVTFYNCFNIFQTVLGAFKHDSIVYLLEAKKKNQKNQRPEGPELCRTLKVEML